MSPRSIRHLHVLTTDYLLTTYFSQSIEATYLKGGGSFNAVFLRRSFLTLMVKIMKIDPRLLKLL